MAMTRPGDHGGVRSKNLDDAVRGRGVIAERPRQHVGGRQVRSDRHDRRVRDRARNVELLPPHVGPLRIVIAAVQVQADHAWGDTWPDEGANPTDALVARDDEMSTSVRSQSLGIRIDVTRVRDDGKFPTQR
jgi:hypothetical protein